MPHRTTRRTIASMSAVALPDTCPDLHLAARRKAVGVPTRHRRPPADPDIRSLAAAWQRALAAAERALVAARDELPSPYLLERHRALGAERRATAALLIRMSSSKDAVALELSGLQRLFAPQDIELLG